jgi:sRNA-binding protein
VTESELRARWPAAFNDARRPLALGIHEQLGLEYPDQVLREWTGHPRYLRHVLEPGAQRIDLKGQPTGTVTAAERRYAWNRLMWFKHDLSGVVARGIRSLTTDERKELKRALPRRPKEGE